MTSSSKPRTSPIKSSSRRQVLLVACEWAFVWASVYVMPASAWALGNRVGNGGNAVLCHGTAQLLDFYEAGLSFPPMTPTAAFPIDPRLAKARLADLEKVHPALAAQFRARLDTLPADIQVQNGARLAVIDDSKHIFEPADPSCAVRQLAIRRTETLGEEKRFLIDGDMWKLLDPTSQAGLLLHEVIYEYFFKLGETDSRKARYFNAALFGGKIAKMSKPEYWAMVQKLKIAMYP